MTTAKRKSGTVHPTGPAPDRRAKREMGATMARIEDVPHLRNLFRQYKLFHDDANMIWLVTQLRDTAIEHLRLVKAKIPRPTTAYERERYQAEGISMEWNLNDYDDATTFGLLVSTRDTRMSTSQKCAAALLKHCSEALKLNAVPNSVKDWILQSTRDTRMSPSQKCAALLKHCSEALKLDAVPNSVKDWILQSTRDISMSASQKCAAALLSHCFLEITRDTRMSPSQKCAALLKHCSEALKLDAVPDHLRDWILEITRDTRMSTSQKCAAALLKHCSEALKLNAVPDHLRDWIFDAYAGLDLDAVETGKKFSRGKAKGAIGPMRALVRKMLKKMSYADLSARGHFARDLWNTCKALPERKRCGIEFYDDHAFIPDHPSVTFDAFANILTQEKKNEKERRTL